MVSFLWNSEFVTDLRQNLHSKTETHAIFIGFQKAADKVPHQRLFKLHAFQIEPSAIVWISNFLVDRSQNVCYERESSSHQKVKSGVPKNTVLGPLIFLFLYMNDLPATTQSTIRLYAHDCVVHKKISRICDCIDLQNDLTEIETWCPKRQMKINISKQNV